jgi:hypothetical protein
MADVGNLIVVVGAVIPALYTSRKNPEYPDTFLHRFAYSAILGLLVAITGAFSCFHQLLARPVPWPQRWGIEIIGHHYIILLGFLMLGLDLLFRLFASKITDDLRRQISIIILILLAMGIATHALLLSNSYT